MAARLRQWRKDRKLSQAELGRLLEVGASAVSRWETGTKAPGRRAALELERVSRGKLLAGAW